MCVCICVHVLLELLVRFVVPEETMSSCLQAISEAEPCSTYLQKAAESLSRTCQASESQNADGEEMVCLQNLQSIADYIHSAQVSSSSQKQNCTARL